MGKSQGDSQDLRIDEIVGLLHKVSPSTLAEIKEQYPDQEMLFKIGQTMGGAIPVAILLSATNRALEMIVPWGESAIMLCRKRLAIARKLELGGSLVAIVGSGMCLMFATTPGARVKTTVTAIIAVIGNLFVAVGNYYRGTLLGGKRGLEDTYSILLRSMPELRFIQSEVDELTRRDAGAVAERDIRALVRRSQELCKQIYQATKEVPGSPKN